jgi:hypothetical protein
MRQARRVLKQAIDSYKGNYVRGITYTIILKYVFNMPYYVKSEIGE